ncbi:hypothetical protein RF11_04408 [Thelohanellus kitauei]|uniref:Uncharacterized protein n=1 Tax=Thelohanellus kitauei TaxID=669202 RepID=A0A0C2M1C0_THEKT|nr:hypothetical protein RF11_04408 [Thelohanellus kitauei]
MLVYEEISRSLFMALVVVMALSPQSSKSFCRPDDKTLLESFLVTSLTEDPNLEDRKYMEDGDMDRATIQCAFENSSDVLYTNIIVECCNNATTRAMESSEEILSREEIIQYEEVRRKWCHKFSLSLGDCLFFDFGLESKQYFQDRYFEFL